MKRKILTVMLMISSLLFVACSGESEEESSTSEVTEEVEESSSLEDENSDTSSEESTDEDGASGTGEVEFTPGTYEATATGHNGDITVSVTFTEDELTEIKIVDHLESNGIGNYPLEHIPQAIIENRSLAVDNMTGATLTSVGVKNAVADTVQQAGVNPEDFQAEVEDEIVDTGEVEQLETDVLVIGGGGAGLSSAIEASRQGAKVLIIEKNDYLGGDTGRAGGGIEAAGTETQKEHGVEDSPEAFAAHIRSRGITYENENLLDIMTENSADSITFLEELGGDMSGLVGGHGTDTPRAHRPQEGPAGLGVVTPMINEVNNNEPIDYMLGTRGYELITDGPQVVGAKATHTDSGQEYEITADAVIISTGNFASNNELVAQYNPRFEGLSTNSSAGSQGDGLKMGLEVGADTELMDIMRVKSNVPSTENTIALDQDGERFMNERVDDQVWMEGKDPHIKAVEDREEKFFWAVTDSQEIEDNFETYSQYLTRSEYVEGESIEELADAMGIDVSVVEASINDWNTTVENGEDTEFGREDLGRGIGEGSYYAFKVTPMVHTTVGGIRFNEKCQVVDENNEPIPGLYAAGEVTGGSHDGVSAVGNAVTYGRLTGQSAGAYAVEQE